MSGETSKRSSLIDITYQQLHGLLTERPDNANTDQISQALRVRVEQLGNVSEPFGKPSDASKKKIESGLVKLKDGVIIRVEKPDQPFVLAISKKFDIDEVEALILLRSFLYNQGIPPISGDGGAAINELLDLITPFYYSERLYILRVLLPLLRSYAVPEESPIGPLAGDFLPRIIKDGKAFARGVVDEYVKKTNAAVPQGSDIDPRKAAQWAKQNAKEQLVMLEVLFWTMWDYASPDAELVLQIYRTAYERNMGSAQANFALLHDDEGTQILTDSSSLWAIIMVEVLELERVSSAAELEISETPVDTKIYWTSPEAIQEIHRMVISDPRIQFGCAYTAWSFFLTRFVDQCKMLPEVPPSYKPFFESLEVALDRSYSEDDPPIPQKMARACLQPESQLFGVILTLLTNTPLFVASVAFRTGSTITDPNSVAYRSVIKGLLMAIVELVPVELIPDFESFIEVWITLFGRSESTSVAKLCSQYWDFDWAEGISRRAVFDAVRVRFPIQGRPLVRLLRSMTATGFTDTDPLCSMDHAIGGDITGDEQRKCGQRVLRYLAKLSTYTQVIPASACSGTHALYEKLSDRLGSSTISTGSTYTNLRPIQLPGGSILPAKSVGRLLSGDGDKIVIAWQHQHSGWKLLLEILTDYVSKRRRASNGASFHQLSFGRTPEPLKVLRLEEIGFECRDDLLVTDILDLFRSLAQDDPNLTEQLLDLLEAEEVATSDPPFEGQTSDLVQLTTTILDDALSRTLLQDGSSYSRGLITSAMGVLTALLALPKYSNRVWLYIRSTTSLFGSERSVGFTSNVLASERLTGQYTITLMLLHLVRQLFDEASANALIVLQETPRLQQIKEEVLMRAVRFVHAEIWVEHAGWKYAQLGDRFEIGRRVSTLYSTIISHCPPNVSGAPLAGLSRAVTEALVSHATPSAIHPLVSPITLANSVLNTLYATRRIGDARRLIYMLEAHLGLIRQLLNYKQRFTNPSQQCLLEQALCSRVSSTASSSDSLSSKMDPIDALADCADNRKMGATIPIMAVEVLFALCSSLSSCEDAPPTVIGHLSNPEATVASFVRIVLHPFDDPLLRNAVWNFITLAVDKEPALAGLFVTGHFRNPSIKGKERESAETTQTTKALSALAVACNMLEQWDELWDLNPQLLASLLRFLDVVWEHAHELKSALASLREDANFFGRLASIMKQELGPSPEYDPTDMTIIDGRPRAQDAVAAYAYRTAVKAHAVHILALDIRMAPSSQGKTKPTSYASIEELLKSEDEIFEVVAEASVGQYNPALYDAANSLIHDYFPTLSLEHLRLQDPLVMRELGDTFVFSPNLLRFRLHPYIDTREEQTHAMLKTLFSINFSMSIGQTQMAWTESMQYLLLQIVPFVRGDKIARPIFLWLASTTSSDLTLERRSGDMMSSVHNAQLLLILALCELTWFGNNDNPQDISNFVELVRNVRDIMLSQTLPPSASFLGKFTVPFHRPLLQIAYFCIRYARNLLQMPKALRAQHRLDITSMVDTVLNFVIDALRLTFDAACTSLDVDLDQEMQLLVAVFEQATRLDLSPSTILWLTRCQETDVIRVSLQLFSRLDVAGLSNLDHLRARKQPLYAPHVLVFHMALASIPSAAERLANEGVLAAYAGNRVSGVLSSGTLDVVLPEFPGERSPAHQAYCIMLAVVSAVTASFNSHGQYFLSDVCGLVQLYSEQIHRALSWTIGDTLTLAHLDEIEQSIMLFSSIATTSKASGQNDAVNRTLRMFADNALLLLQQINYALTHYNHLASLFEPITAEERTAFEAESGHASTDASADIVDLVKRPFLARLVHRMFKISGAILSALVSVSRGEDVLCKEPEDWPVDQALILPYSKVALGEPTSLGTLIELGNCSLDVLHRLVDRPAGQSVSVVVDQSLDKPLDVQDSIIAVRRTFETVAFYGVTQFAMWLSKPVVDNGVVDMDTDEKPGEIGEKELRVVRRLRRGLTGDLAEDLKNLLKRGAPLIAKTASIVGPKEVDLTPVLSRFVQERIVIPT